MSLKIITKQKMESEELKQINCMTVNPKIMQAAIGTDTGIELINYSSHEKLVRGKFKIANQ
jgi:hypothetical protein